MLSQTAPKFLLMPSPSPSQLAIWRGRVDTLEVRQGWDVKRLYFGRRNKPAMDEEGVTLEKDMEKFLGQCDVVAVNVPLSDKTK